MQRSEIAVAGFEGASNWTWHLRIDDPGVYRWYLNGVVKTKFRASSRMLAESALRRYVENTLHRELRIVECSKG